MRIPGLISKLWPLLRRAPETEYERALMLHAFSRHGERAASWLKFSVGLVLALLMAIFQSTADGELGCLAQNIYFEARNEPQEGRIAVAHVVLNRVADRRFPATVCAVIRQDTRPGDEVCQFSWYCDGQSNRSRKGADWVRALALADRVYWGALADPTDGALWYHADYVKPAWRRRLHRGPKFGAHIFYWDTPRDADRPDS